LRVIKKKKKKLSGGGGGGIVLCIFENALPPIFSVMHPQLLGA